MDWIINIFRMTQVLLLSSSVNVQTVLAGTQTTISATWILSPTTVLFSRAPGCSPCARRPSGGFGPLVPSYSDNALQMLTILHNWGHSPAYFGISTKTNSFTAIDRDLDQFPFPITTCDKKIDNVIRPIAVGHVSGSDDITILKHKLEIKYLFINTNYT